MNVDKVSSMRTRGISLLVQEISAILKILQARDDVQKHTRLVVLVDTVNAMLLPHAWAGVDSEHMFHVTYTMHDAKRPTPIVLHYAADYVWRVEPGLGRIVCVKSRTEHAGKTYPLDPATVKFLAGLG